MENTKRRLNLSALTSKSSFPGEDDDSLAVSQTKSMGEKSDTLPIQDQKENTKGTPKKAKTEGATEKNIGDIPEKKIPKKRNSMISISSIKAAPQKKEIEKIENSSSQKDDTLKKSETLHNMSDSSPITSQDSVTDPQLSSLLHTESETSESIAHNNPLEKKGVQNKEKGKEKKEIKIDDGLFDNYTPSYNKRENKKTGTESEISLINTHKGSIIGHKKKRNLIIVAMILCFLGAGAFVLMPYITDQDDIKASVIESRIEDTRQSVNQIINNDEKTQEMNTSTGTHISETNNIASNKNQDDASIDTAQIKEKEKVNSYLLENYYK